MVFALSRNGLARKSPFNDKNIISPRHIKYQLSLLLLTWLYQKMDIGDAGSLLWRIAGTIATKQSVLDRVEGALARIAERERPFRRIFKNQFNRDI